MAEKLSPERAVRLLRAKAAELENRVLQAAEWQVPKDGEIAILTADIALVMSLLADHIERETADYVKIAEAYIAATNPGIDMDEVRALRGQIVVSPVEDGGEIECRAKRWNGTPCYDGPHASHFFTYGPKGEYTGSCAGRE